ncbi:MAG TPA: 4-phosphoerythronate dehydrogenase [Mariprofundaceae bacterium]|nr:4-phosphoerythronate dehydrogenase [Mariprofundaceae bacterium]
MTNPLKIVADAHIWGVKSAFASLPGFDVELCILESSEIRHRALLDADILLTRSATRVDAALLEGTPVRFAATATIGDDHYDKAWLESHGIAHANAAGSSTESVVEYLAATLLHLHTTGRIDIPSTTLGIIGVGRIGSRLAEFAGSWGIRVLRNDPPRARKEGSEGFSTLDTVLEKADLISLHTPLIRHGEDRTLHLLDGDCLARFRGNGIINAARGSCVDNHALDRWLDTDSARYAVLDCWEHEPDISRVLLAHPGCLLPTPHIAGHSLDGKAANTLYVYEALCEFLGVTTEWSPGLDGGDRIPLQIEASGDDWQQLQAIVRQLYPILNDAETMRGWLDLSAEELPRAFATFRRHYPERRSWPAFAVRLDRPAESLRKKAAAIGIHIL